MIEPAHAALRDDSTAGDTPRLVAARAACVAAQAELHAALVDAIGAAVHTGYPTAAQVAFVTDTATPPRLVRVELADDHETPLAVLAAGDEVFAALAALHPEWVEVTGDLEAELDLAVAG